MIEIPVVLLERDLFFVTRIRESLKTAGRPVVVVKSADDLRARLAAKMQIALLMVSIGTPDTGWEAAIAMARAANLPVLAYGAHVDSAAQTAAREAGATRVIGNSKLAGDIVAQVEQTLARASRTDVVAETTED